MSHNKIFIISGPSGAGKGTIIEALRKIEKLNLVWAKSYTTRAKRDSDNIEQKYVFIDETKFKALEKVGEIFESNFFNHHWYGSSKSEIERTLNNNKNVIKDIDVNGGVYYKQNFPEAILIFIKADLDKIKQRLIDRKQNSLEEIEDRLKTAKKEMTFEKQYDFSVLNVEGKPEKAIDEIKNIILKELK